jgi:hypothetical protein
MEIYFKLIDFIKRYLLIFFLICLSGNPLFTHMNYSKNLLIVYTVILFSFILFKVDFRLVKKAAGIFFGVILIISILIIFQNNILGFVSFPGVAGYILKIVLTISTLLFYQNEKVDYIDKYIKTFAFLAAISIPFWLLNQIGFYGIEIENSTRKSLLFYTSSYNSSDRFIMRNPGMFWEPGAFSGYLILALVFIALKNRKFQIGPYTKEVFWILFGIFTTMSTTGFLVLGFISTIYLIQNYGLGNIILIPIVILFSIFAYNNLYFLREKIDDQYSRLSEMDEDDISNQRMGAFYMDLQYIKSKPLIGNGLHVKTRFRFHPEVKGDIGHGNGMSNFLASWGIPFFLFWLFCVLKFSVKMSRSHITSLSAVFIIILLLQGEQFLNFPIFLSFFFLPFVYDNILSAKNKFYIIKNYFGIKTGI